MVQNPKGGGLSSTLGGSQMMGGVQKTTDFLDKSTWTLATILIALILLSSLSFSDSMGTQESKIIDGTEAAAPINAAPVNGATNTATPNTAAPATTTETAPVEAAPVETPAQN